MSSFSLIAYGVYTVDTPDVVQVIDDVPIFLRCWLRDLYSRAHLWVTWSGINYIGFKFKLNRSPSSNARGDDRAYVLLLNLDQQFRNDIFDRHLVGIPEFTSERAVSKNGEKNESKSRFDRNDFETISKRHRCAFVLNNLMTSESRGVVTISFAIFFFMSFVFFEFFSFI